MTSSLRQDSDKQTGMVDDFEDFCKGKSWCSSNTCETKTSPTFRLATIFSIISLCSAFNLPTGNKAKAFFNGRLEVILEFTPNTVDSHIAKGFLVSRDSKKKKRCVHCD